MSYLILGFITGMSLILALGPQNIFVIEQGLKKEFIFLVCLICSLSDLLLIFLGIFIFHYFQAFYTPLIELILNLLLLIFTNVFFVLSIIKFSFSLILIANWLVLTLYFFLPQNSYKLILLADS